VANGNGRGGARPGSGPKKKPLADKILSGNPGKLPLEVITFPTADLTGVDMPPPQEYMAAKQRNGVTALLAVTVYERTWQWLAERGCAHFIPPQVIENYAQTVGRWVQCEEAISEHGFLSKHPTTGAPIPSPFVSMSQSFMKQANNLWNQIYLVMRENCLMPYDGKSPQDDVMERLLSTRQGNKA